MTTCPKCNYTRQPTDTNPDYECPRCGVVYAKFKSTPVAAETIAPAKQKGADEKFCADCGEIINIKAEICPKCGVRQARPPEPAGKKQKFVAGILALFLGGLGIHKFYLDQGIQGLIYLVFCWTFIPAFLGLLEGLNYLTMSQRVFDERYNSGR